MQSDRHLRLSTLDRDEAIGEAAARLDPVTRAAFLRRAAAAGGMVAAAGAFAALADPAQAASASDVDILNFALSLEYLEAAFYTEAERRGHLRGDYAHFAHVVGAHERAHVTALAGVLGGKAVKRPAFDFGDTTAKPEPFITTAISLEETGVAAYKGQAPAIQGTHVLEAALAIHTVEARHTSWARRLAGWPPTKGPFDHPLDRDQVMAAVRQTGFVSDPVTSASKDPPFNG